MKGPFKLETYTERLLRSEIIWVYWQGVEYVVVAERRDDCLGLEVWNTLTGSRRMLLRVLSSDDQAPTEECVQEVLNTKCIDGKSVSDIILADNPEGDTLEEFYETLDHNGEIEFDVGDRHFHLEACAALAADGVTELDGPDEMDRVLWDLAPDKLDPIYRIYEADFPNNMRVWIDEALDTPCIDGKSIRELLPVINVTLCS